MEGDGVWACVESCFGEFFAHVDDVVAQAVRHSIWVGVRCTGFRGDGLCAAGVELREELVDALAGDAEAFGDFDDWFTLIAYGFDDGEIAVRGVSGSLCVRL